MAGVFQMDGTLAGEHFPGKDTEPVMGNLIGVLLSTSLHGASSCDKSGRLG